jgi:hypothetical protein
LQAAFEQHRDTVPDKEVRIAFGIVGFELVTDGDIVQVAFFQVAEGITDDLPGRSEKIGVMYANLQESTVRCGK